MHFTLFGKSVLMICMSVMVIILQGIDMLSQAIPASLMKITWATLMGFMIWFVISVYKDYKDFKSKVYPTISDFNARISVIERELELKR